MNTKKIKRNEASIFSAEDFAPENTKERVTTLIDEDVVDWMRAEAKRTGIGYQTFMNIQLRSLMNASKDKRSRSERPEFEFARVVGESSREEEFSPRFLAKIDSLVEMKVEQRFKAAGVATPSRRSTLKSRRK